MLSLTRCLISCYEVICGVGSDRGIVSLPTESAIPEKVGDFRILQAFRTISRQYPLRASSLRLASRLTTNGNRAMPRDIPVGNGRLLVTFDNRYQIRDVYFPHVGQENHAGAGPCRFGVYTDIPTK